MEADSVGDAQACAFGGQPCESAGWVDPDWTFEDGQAIAASLIHGEPEDMEVAGGGGDAGRPVFGDITTK